MLEILQNMVSALIANSALTAIVPATNILVGPVDIVMEQQQSTPNATTPLLYPQINIRVVSEVQRSNPLGARDTLLQLDIWDRNSQLEVEQIYELVISTLQYTSGNQGSAHIFWERLGGAVDDYEGDRRIWHRAVTFAVWSIK